MIDLKDRLQKARLYLVTGQDMSNGRSTPFIVEEALKGGVDVVQLREYSLKGGQLVETAFRCRELTRRYGALFIVNNRPDVARLTEADGVHIGQDDIPLREAREIMGERGLVGVSTHALEQARKAVADGADYIGVGPVFATPTKAGRPPVNLSYVREVAAFAPPVPFFAIGGIDDSNLESVLQAGAKRVAVVRALTGAADPLLAARRLRSLIDKYPLADPGS